MTKYTQQEKRKLNSIQYELSKLQQEQTPDFEKVAHLKMFRNAIKQNAKNRRNGKPSHNYNHLSRRVNAYRTLQRILNESKERRGEV